MIQKLHTYIIMMMITIITTTITIGTIHHLRAISREEGIERFLPEESGSVEGVALRCDSTDHALAIGLNMQGPRCTFEAMRFFGVSETHKIANLIINVAFTKLSLSLR